MQPVPFRKALILFVSMIIFSIRSFTTSAGLLLYHSRSSMKTASKELLVLRLEQPCLWVVRAMRESQSLLQKWLVCGVASLFSFFTVGYLFNGRVCVFDLTLLQLPVEQAASATAVGRGVFPAVCDDIYCLHVVLADVFVS